MIAHIVLFKPRESLSADQQREILLTVAESVRRCPTVRSCRVGRRSRHGTPGYEQAMREDYRYALMLEFDDLQGLTDYLIHPAHEKLGAIFSTASAAALAYDYDMLSMDDIHLLI